MLALCRTRVVLRWGISSAASASCRTFRCVSSLNSSGISNPYLSQIERGLRAPSDHVVQSIADVLHVSADTLYRQAGVRRDSDGPSKVVEAIREDPDLTGRQRQALLEIYDAFTRSRLRPRRR